jgi:hypothetical protein
MLVSVRAAGLARTRRAFPAKVEEKSQRSRLMIPSGAKEKRAASAIPLRREGSRVTLTSVRLLCGRSGDAAGRRWRDRFRQEQSRCERRSTRPLVVQSGRLTLDLRDARNHAKPELARELPARVGVSGSYARRTRQGNVGSWHRVHLRLERVRRVGVAAAAWRRLRGHRIGDRALRPDGLTAAVRLWRPRELLRPRFALRPLRSAPPRHPGARPSRRGRRRPRPSQLPFASRTSARRPERSPGRWRPPGTTRGATSRRASPSCP